MKKNILLIGFMAVGKGRTARELSRRTGRYALDSDDLIESLTKMKISRIFALHGEPYFRELEKQTGAWLEKRVTGSIVSTGGGFVTVPNLKKIGVVVYLHNEFEEIVAQVNAHPKAEKKIRKRPLLKDLDRAGALYRQRVPLYRDVADIEITVTGKSTKDVAREIIRTLDLKVR